MNKTRKRPMADPNGPVGQNAPPKKKVERTYRSPTNPKGIPKPAPPAGERQEEAKDDESERREGKGWN